MGGAKTVAVAEPVVMPEVDDAKVMAARKKKAADVQSRSGRASTIMTDSDSLGG